MTVVVTAFLALLVGGSQAMAYPGCNIDATVTPDRVAAGGKITVTAKANGDCDWTVEWNGQTRTGSTAAHQPFTAIFTATKADRGQRINANVSCLNTAPVDARTASGECDGPTLAMPVSVLAANNVDTDGDLPNTGGPSWYLLAGGLLLLIAGAGAVRASRRETAEVEAN